MDLSTLQREFVAAVFAPGARPPIAILDEAPGREARFAVYRNNALANLAAALLDVHPVVARLVGPAFFDHVAQQYALAYPSVSGDIHDYGGHFAEYLEAHPAAAGLPWLADVARLEWAWHEAFHAASPQPFDWSRLAAVEPARQGQLWFVPHPALRLVRSPFPVLHIWEVNQPDRDGEDAVDLDEGGDLLTVLRGPDHLIAIERVAAATYALLDACRLGRPVADAIAAALAIDPETDSGAMLRDMIGRGLLVGFEPG
jgi:hypothetical protein